MKLFKCTEDWGIIYKDLLEFWLVKKASTENFYCDIIHVCITITFKLCNKPVLKSVRVNVCFLEMKINKNFFS